jgi:hypothetical protein
MMTRTIGRIALFMLVAGQCFTGRGEKLGSFEPGEVWADTEGNPINAHAGGVLWVEGDRTQAGRYYWFGQHMVAGEEGNAAQVGVRVYSSGDLYNWENEGVALSVSADPTSEIAKGCILERPKVIYNRKTRKFVMWFHLEPAGKGYGAARSGVAVAERVAGPYRYLGSFRPDAGAWPMNVPGQMKRPLTEAEALALQECRLGGGYDPSYPEDLIFRRDFAGGQMARDMNLFVDEELTEDYLKPAGRYIRVFPKRFSEAPAMFKSKGRYFLITSGCTGWAPNAARLAVADSIWGPWKELGNPWRGPKEQADISFDSQSTFVLPVRGKSDAFIFMADRWRPKNAIDGRYVWMPIRWQDGLPYLEWVKEWDLAAVRRQ